MATKREELAATLDAWENPKKTKKVLSGIYSEMLSNQMKVISELERLLANNRKLVLRTTLAEHFVAEMKDDEMRTLEEISQQVERVLSVVFVDEGWTR